MSLKLKVKPYLRKRGNMLVSSNKVKSVVKIAKQVAKKEIAKAAEDKYIETVNTTIPFDVASGSVGTLLNGIQVGANSYQRIGRHIKLKYMLFKCRINQLTALTFADQVLRFLIVWDREPNGMATVPNFSNVMASAAGTSDPFSFPNLSNEKRFQILMDRTIKVPTQNASGLSGSTQTSSIEQREKNYFSKTIKLNRKTLFTALGNAGTIADIDKGALFIVANALVYAAGNTNTHQMVFNARILFEDV